jgi:hypothetical protein
VLLCLSPLVIGGMGVAEGPAQFGGAPGAEAARDAASHYRYLSGIFVGVGAMALSCVPRIEAMSARFRWVVALVVCGGLARLYGIAVEGWPGAGHVAGLAIELGAVPLLGVWQARLARRFG